MSVQFLSKTAVASFLQTFPRCVHSTILKELDTLEKFVISENKDQECVDTLIAEYIIFREFKDKRSQFTSHLRRSVLTMISRLEKKSLFIMRDVEWKYCAKQNYIYLEDAIGFSINDKKDIPLIHMDESVVMLLVSYLNQNYEMTPVANTNANNCISQLLNDELAFVVSVDMVKDKKNTDMLVPVSIWKSSSDIKITCISIKNTLLSDVVKVRDLTLNQYVNTHKSMRLNDELLNHLNLWMSIAQHKKALNGPAFCQVKGKEPWLL